MYTLSSLCPFLTSSLHQAEGELVYEPLPPHLQFKDEKDADWDPLDSLMELLDQTMGQVDALVEQEKE